MAEETPGSLCHLQLVLCFTTSHNFPPNVHLEKQPTCRLFTRTDTHQQWVLTTTISFHVVVAIHCRAAASTWTNHMQLCSSYIQVILML